MLISNCHFEKHCIVAEVNKKKTPGAHKTHNKLDHNGALTIRTIWVVNA